jgi:hypothetical protein
MALTMFGGPLSRKLPETRTFTVEGPAHSLLLEPFTRRVRAEVDGVTVLDTTRGALLFETGLPPQLYVPEEDFRADLLEPSGTTTASSPTPCGPTPTRCRRPRGSRAARCSRPRPPTAGSTRTTR